MYRIRVARTRTFLAATAVLALTLAGCGTKSSSTATGATNSAASGDSSPSATTAAVTPGRQTQANEPTTVAAPQTSLQTGVTGRIIETPSEILNATTAATSPALANDYSPSPPDVATVLQAAVPDVTIYDGPTATTASLTLPNPLPSGAPLTFLVDGSTSTRYKVLLPIRPNGRTGWVNPAQVTKFAHKYRLVVELGAHRITAYNGKDVILSEKIATGKDQTPTPNGRYYIKELIKPCYDVKQPDGTKKCVVNNDGPYGPYAYGLSGFSPVVQKFNGGDDVLGLHGTNEPESLGKDFSHGCIRLSNSAITTLAKILPLGTPVIVRP